MATAVRFLITASQLGSAGVLMSNGVTAPFAAQKEESPRAVPIQRFTVEELMSALRRKMTGIDIRIVEDLRETIPGGPVTIQIGRHTSSPRVTVRTLPPSKDGEKTIVYSLGYEQCRQVQVLRRKSVSAAVWHIYRNLPASNCNDGEGTKVVERGEDKHHA